MFVFLFPTAVNYLFQLAINEVSLLIMIIGKKNLPVFVLIYEHFNSFSYSPPVIAGRWGGSEQAAR